MVGKPAAAVISIVETIVLIVGKVPKKTISPKNVLEQRKLADFYDCYDLR
jgi:hypothetical protein